MSDAKGHVTDIATEIQIFGGTVRCSVSVRGVGPVRAYTAQLPPTVRKHAPFRRHVDPKVRV